MSRNGAVLKNAYRCFCCPSKHLKTYLWWGKLKISFNCYNSRNICHSEERFSVLESPGHVMPSLMLYLVVWHWEICIRRFRDVNHKALLWHFATFYPWNDQDIYPRQCAKFGRKGAKSANLPKMLSHVLLWCSLMFSSKLKLYILRWLTTVFLRLSSARYHSLPQVSICRAFKKWRK